MVLTPRNKIMTKGKKTSRQEDDSSLIKHTSATCVSMADEAFRNQDYQTAIAKYIESIRMILPSQELNSVHLTTEQKRQYCFATSTLLKLYAVYCKNKDQEDAKKSLDSATALIEKVLLHQNEENIDFNKESYLISVSALTLYSQIKEAEGDKYYADEDYTHADETYHEALKWKQKCMELNSDSFLIRVSALTLYSQILEAEGDIFYAKQDYTHADETYHNALNWRQKSIDLVSLQETFEKKKNSDTDMANLLKKTGEVLKFRGHYVPSASALSESLSIHLQSGKDYSDKAIVSLLHTLIQVHKESNEYSKAIQYMNLLEEKSNMEITFEFLIQKSQLYALNLDFQVAMDTATNLLDLSNSQGKNYNQRLLLRATATTQIANVLEARGSLTDAILWHQRAQQIRLDILSNTHADVLQNAKSIASIYMKQGEFNQAKEIYKKIRDDLLKAHGTKHLSVAELMDDLGGVYYEQHHFSTALKCFEKGLEIRKLCLGKDSTNLDVAQNMERIASCLLRHGKRFEAMELFAESINILRKNHFCPKHPKMQKLVQSMTASEDEYCNYDAEVSTINTSVLSK